MRSFTRDAARRTISPQSPMTPLSTEAVASLHNLINKDIQFLGEAPADRLQKHVQKLTNATQLSFAKRALLQDDVRFLSKINNEAKVRRATKSKVVGTVRVISFKDLESTRSARATKEAAKKAASDARKARKAEKASRVAVKVAKPPTYKRRRGWKSQNAADIDALEPLVEILSDDSVQIPNGALGPWQAPVAKMW